MISFVDACKSDEPFLELIQLLSPHYSRKEPVPGEDWVPIVEYAKNMQVVPLLFYMLKQKPGIAPPANLYTQLKSVYLANSTRNLFLTRDLIRILIAFDQNAIPAIPLKGAYLAHVVYEDPSARQMTDLDIMVKRDDVTKAVTNLETLGYVATGTYHLDDEYYRYNHHLPGFLHPSGTRVEIHWNILKPLNMGEKGIQLEEMFWLQAKPGDLMGATAYLLAPEVLIFHSAVHLTMHHLFNSGVRDFYDVERIYRKFHDVIDWEFLISMTREMKLERPLRLTLALTDMITGSDISDELKRKGLDLDIPDQYLVAAFDMMVRGGPSYNVSLRVAEKNPGPFAIVRTTVHRILLTRKTIGMKYHVPADSLGIYFCYPYHLYDLLVRHGLDLFREQMNFPYEREYQGFWEWMKKV